MKKLLFLTGAVLLFSVSAFAQGAGKVSTRDFSGVWNLDVSKSKLDERSRIESQTMTVSQIGNDLKVTTETKRKEPPADAAAAGGGAGRSGGRGFQSPIETTTFTLDGKETTTQRETPRGSIPTKHTAMLDQGRVRISSSSTFTGQNGEVTMTSKETWTMSDDGKTLTVERESNSPRGASASTMVFVKK